MVHVWKVRVLVDERCVLMLVGVWRSSRHRVDVEVLVMFVVHVAVFVDDGLVLVLVLVALGDV